MSLRDDLETLLFTLTRKSDSDVESAITEFCRQFDFNVFVCRNHGAQREVKINDKRGFMITFASESLAICFANSIQQQTYGFKGLMVYVE